MSRWKILQDALCHKKRSTGHQSSIHRFTGHSSLEKSKLIWRGFEVKISCSKLLDELNDIDSFIKFCKDYIEKVDCPEIRVCFTCSNSWEKESIEIVVKRFLDSEPESLKIHLLDPNPELIPIKVIDKTYTPQEKSFRFYRYNLSSSEKVEIVTREPIENKTITINDLLSDRLYGVDNTGNICVWPSEPLLLRVLLENDRLRGLIVNKSLLELGGGLTGLVGLSLSVSGISNPVLLTDGHPSCVRNQGICIEMCKSVGRVPSDGSISSKVLNWASYNKKEIGEWEVIIGADCLFFQDFHSALIHLLSDLLSPDGVALFFQPRRSGSMENFQMKAAAYFQIELVEDYSPQISAERDRYLLEKSDIYDADVHYPILLILTRKQQYCTCRNEEKQLINEKAMLSLGEDQITAK